MRTVPEIEDPSRYSSVGSSEGCSVIVRDSVGSIVVSCTVAIVTVVSSAPAGKTKLGSVSCSS